MTIAHELSGNRHVIEMASLLQRDATDEDFISALNCAADFWREMPADDFVATPELKSDLEQIAHSFSCSLRKLKRIRRHFKMQMLMHHNKVPCFPDERGNPFGDDTIVSIDLIAQLCRILASDMTISNGPKGDPTRVASWEQATRLYEKSTGEKATRSRNKDGSIQGRWVDFMLAFCAVAKPTYEAELGALEAFYKRREKILKSGRDPLETLVMGA